MTRIITTLLCAFVSFNVSSQDGTCGFDHHLDKQINQNPQLLTKLESQERSITRWNKARSLHAEDFEIPVVVHVLHLNEATGTGSNISDGQVNSALIRLNEAFSGSGVFPGLDSGIRFSLAARTPDCAESTGIVRTDARSVCVNGDCYNSKGLTANNENAVKSLSSWPTYDYLNIWVVNEIDNNDGNSGIQAYADFPGTEAQHEGIVILSNVFGAQNEAGSHDLKPGAELGTILIHEVGHALGLYHTFEGDDLNRDGVSDRCPSFTGCGPVKGDCLDDTPPHKRSLNNCPTDNINVCDGGTSNELIIHNFMDYSSEVCQSEFTDGQIQRMQTILLSERLSWTKSNGHLAVDFFQPQEASCQPQTRILTNSFGLGIEEFRLGDFTEISGSATDDGGYVDRWCAAAKVQTGKTYNVFINTGDRNYQNVKVFCDYDGDGDFDDTGEEIFASEYSKTHSGKVTIPSFAKKGVPLRLRAIAGYAGFEITNGCHTPYYGQVEDYSLIIGSLAVPVTIKSLKVSLTNNGGLVTWIARGEQKIQKYDIERSIDGKHFQKIASLSGNKKSYSKYQHLDQQSLDSDNFYRLRIHDVYGGVFFSGIVYLANPGTSNNSYTVFPNPVIGQGARIAKMDAANQATIQRVELMDQGGNVLALLRSGSFRDETELDVKLPAVKRGIYYIRITTNQGVSMQRVSKL
ncbi:MAG: zinc-dependent metalloprotease [Saprospiraceae bacterium]|nr:zinc-dependent metalloprotease [Saprospiraceae bacterium]